jgi:hypothetical protein
MHQALSGCFVHVQRERDSANTQVMGLCAVMEERGVPIDEYVVSTLVEAYVSCGLLESAERLVKPGGVYHRCAPVCVCMYVCMYVCT